MKEPSNDYRLYERLVHDLFGSRIHKDYQLHQSKRYLGRVTAHHHQIDFSFEGDVGGARLLFLGECKLYKRPVSLDQIMAFAFRLWDIAAHKGIFVACNGFQKGAFKIASGVGMSLVICRNSQLSFELSKKRRDIPVQDFISANQLEISSKFEFALLTSDVECNLIEGLPLVDHFIKG